MSQARTYTVVRPWGTVTKCAHARLTWDEECRVTCRDCGDVMRAHRPVSADRGRHI